MTVLVDTSPWIDSLRGSGGLHNPYIRDAIPAGIPLGWTEPVLYELTAGVGSARRGAELRTPAAVVVRCAVDGLQGWEVAAYL